MMPSNKTRIEGVSAKPLLWLIMVCYMMTAGYAILHHEPWGDELHGWNIAKGSSTFFNLISNTRYEGHPPLWHAIMWVISKFTPHFIWVQLCHLAIASLTIFIILFYTPFSTFNKILLPFGYYFLFEYSTLSRNYAIGVLMAFLICIVFQKNFRYKYGVYYLLLFMMSNTHLLSVILAGCLHLYLLSDLYQQKAKLKTLLAHTFIGCILFIPALYCIWPPSDSELGAVNWMQRWNASQLAVDLQAPLRAFVPIPAWSTFSFWNQQFLLALHTDYSWLKFVYPVLAISLIAIACYLIRNSKKALWLFIVNLLLTCVIGNVIILSTQRQTGYIFISFLVAYWLAAREKPLKDRSSKWLLNGLLLLQMIAGVFAIAKDNMLPFSNYYRVNELLREIPSTEKVVTDYWALIAITAYTEKPAYSIDMQQTVPFSLWKNDMLEMRLTPNRYCNGLNNLFKNGHLSKVYLLSTSEPKLLAEIDSRLFTTFNVRLVDAREGAIEKSSNLYLYQISPLQ